MLLLSPNTFVLSTSKNFKINVYKTIILSVALYDCERWSLTLRDEYRPKTFESKIRREMRMMSGEGSTMGNFVVCVIHLL